MREEITVPFSKKNEALSLGAEFDTVTRKWYITNNTEFDHHEVLRHLADRPELTNIPADSLAAQRLEDFVSTKEKQEDSESINGNVQDSVASLSDEENDDRADWKSILAKEDSLLIAMTLRDENLPQKEEDRILMLNLLNIRTPGNYPFTYDGMINLSDSFEAAYPPERVQALAMRLTSPGNYMVRIRNSDLTPEEKALMYFVLPFGAE